MARRGNFFSTMQRIAHQAAREQRLAEAAQRRAERDALRLQAEALRLRAQANKVELQRYQERRAEEAETMTTDVQRSVEAFRGILERTLAVDDTISFSSLLLKEQVVPFDPPAEIKTPGNPPDKSTFTTLVRPRGILERALSMRARYEREMQEAETRFNEAVARHEAAERERKQKLAGLQAKHEEAVRTHRQEVKDRNDEVQELERAYRAGEAGAVIAYCTMVLERSQYPEDFPQEFRLAYVPESKDLLIDYELPGVDVVPEAQEHRYIKSKDAIETKARKAGEIREIYQDIVSAIALRTIHEVFEADQGNHLAVVVFNGFVSTVDPATGQDIKPYLISVRTTRERFLELDLARIDKRACLRNLGARVSAHPTELQAVKPLVEFDMVDKRFIEGSDILADLESRPNLMDLTPFEFENLVGNLFARMGLETKQTRSSRDGGVDAVAFDTRPVVGGKVVIQAKRYKNTVGVSAVRDLYGTMQHEGANKGILVSTSTYGPDAYDFIKGKPIELIDGGGLLYYLEQHTQVKARIVFPQDVS